MIQIIVEFFGRRGIGNEFTLLLALAALALLVAPSYPLAYGAGVVAAVLVMEALARKKEGMDMMKEVRLKLAGGGVAVVKDVDQGGPVYLRRPGGGLEVYEDVWEAPEEVLEAFERYLELENMEVSG